MKEQIPLWKKGGFGVVCLQDLRFSEAEIPMAVEAMKAGWGGAGMKFRYGDVEEGDGRIRHGTMVAVREDWAPLVHSWEDDPRGWGRYTAVSLVGNQIRGDNDSGNRGGEAETLVIVSCYSPAVGGGQYTWQEEELKSAMGLHSSEEEERGGEEK